MQQLQIRFLPLLLVLWLKSAVILSGVQAHDDLVSVNSVRSPIVSLSTSSLAGEYVFGSPGWWGKHLTLSLNGRFRLVTGSDVISSTPIWGGLWSLKDGSIILVPKSHPEKRRIKDIPIRLLPVQWGERQYLVADNQLLDFCNAVNLGEEPYFKDEHMYHMFFLRKGDEEKPIQGQPNLAPTWKDYLLPFPLHGRVLRVEENKVYTIDLGRRDGIRNGMILTKKAIDSIAEIEFDHDLKVVWVSETTALLKNRYDKPPTGMIRPQAKAKVGQVLSTRRQRFLGVQIVTDQESQRVRIPRK